MLESFKYGGGVMIWGSKCLGLGFLGWELGITWKGVGFMGEL